jgi:DNA-binding XRE family transcriptional regulator
VLVQRDTTAFGTLIQERREELNKQRCEVGEECGRCEKSVYLWETGRATPPYSVKLRLARALNLPFSALTAR